MQCLASGGGGWGGDSMDVWRSFNPTKAFFKWLRWFGKGHLLSELHVPHEQCLTGFFCFFYQHLASSPQQKRAYSALHPQALTECSPLDFRSSDGENNNHSLLTNLSRASFFFSFFFFFLSFFKHTSQDSKSNDKWGQNYFPNLLNPWVVSVDLSALPLAKKSTLYLCQDWNEWSSMIERVLPALWTVEFWAARDTRVPLGQAYSIISKITPFSKQNA